eukprot:CAMPEP_0115131254 /NCGR_PEP_ID=MMETSP0227-20121206/52995_1 /TAXON_ID=89957 /ORGANISM="Polarella glacialis, Strain CCMP 1383" /LENGTH=75 /DNA_ID=CAMNT_0002536715 /DNA_START=325 /DNA_END=552 /DNA_ORIENTATION=+
MRCSRRSRKGPWCWQSPAHLNGQRFAGQRAACVLLALLPPAAVRAAFKGAAPLRGTVTAPVPSASPVLIFLTMDS